MAGDWIKMTCGLENDPAVIALCSALDMDGDAIIGKLYRLWTWADQHLEDGNAPGVTDSWVDRYLGVSGIAEVLVSIHWLSHNGTGIVIPDFDKHMGQSAKRRALTSRRVAKHRSNAPTVTRVEKSREEKSEEEQSIEEKSPKNGSGPVRSAKPKRTRVVYPSEFEAFWKAYSARRRVGKGYAFEAWEKGKGKLAPPKDTPDVVIAAAAVHAEHFDRIGTETSKIPHPTTWLNGRRWEDDIPKDAPILNSASMRSIAAADAYVRRHSDE